VSAAEPLLLADADARAAVDRLAPHARSRLAGAARLAVRLHAEEVTSEHLLAAILADEDAGATRLVLHAFADPETLHAEVLALCPGILVVGSGRSLPFSPRALEALFAARRGARTAGTEVVGSAHVLAAAARELEPELARALAAAGYREPEGWAPPPSAGPRETALFATFEARARRALGAACRAAAQLGRDAISPAHLVLGCAEVAEDAAAAAGLTASRARMCLAGRDEDPSRPEPVSLPPDDGLVALLAGLAPPADTFAVLDRVLSHGSPELRLLLVQQKITPALVERSRGAFPDPRTVL